MWPVLSSDSQLFGSDLLAAVARAVGDGRVLVIGVNPSKLPSALLGTGREVVACEGRTDLDRVFNDEDAKRLDFHAAIWVYSGEDHEDTTVAERLSRCATQIVAVPGAGADFVKRRPQIVESFARFGFLPDYGSQLNEVAFGIIHLRRQLAARAQDLIPSLEAGLGRLNKRVEELQRALRARTSELQIAHEHIVTVEEKLLKLKEYRRELKLLKEERRALRKSPERRIGQVFFSPYRLPQKLLRKLRNRTGHGGKLQTAPMSAYAKWLEKHRAKPQQIEAMRRDWHEFTHQPLVSILMPVFNTPVSWLRDAVESVLAQAYEKWELVVVDDGSSTAEIAKILSALSARDKRIRFAALEHHSGISAALNKGLEMAAGEWIGFLDHDDLLEPDALFQIVKWLQTHSDADLIYSDEDKLTEQGFDSPIFKPDWSPDYFLSCNYVCHFTVIRRELIRQVGWFRSEYDGAQDYDFFLRVIEQTSRIHHVPRVLYHWRRSLTSTADNIGCKPKMIEAGRLALEAHLKRQQQRGHVAIDWRTYLFWVRRDLVEPKKISMIMAVNDGAESLALRLENLSNRTSYAPYEIVLVTSDNHSKPDHDYLHIKRRVLHYAGPFNFSAMNNFAVNHTDSPWLLFLDQTVEPFNPDWLTLMAEQVQRPQVGAVGARLLNPNGTVEHAGIVLGVNGIAQPAFRDFPAEARGVCRQLQAMRNYSAVAGACLLTRREVFNQVGGFDEERLPSAFSDVDLCLKMRRAGYLIVYTPFAKLRYYPQNIGGEEIATREAQTMRERWPEVLERDPYYNPNLSRERANFSLGE